MTEGHVPSSQERNIDIHHLAQGRLFLPQLGEPPLGLVNKGYYYALIFLHQIRPSCSEDQDLAGMTTEALMDVVADHS